jgi:hypothetical protein
MSDAGKKLLKDLAAKVREKTTSTGEPLVHARALVVIDELQKELGGPEGMPGLHVFREGTAKFRLQREKKNGEVVVEWQRPIGAIVVTATVLGSTKSTREYVWDEPQQKWRTLDGLGELWEDVSKALVDVLYPEGK